MKAQLIAKREKHREMIANQQKRIAQFSIKPPEKKNIEGKIDELFKLHQQNPAVCLEAEDMSEFIGCSRSYINYLIKNGKSKIMRLYLAGYAPGFVQEFIDD